MKPYYEEPGITIYHGDCREVLRQLPRHSVTITDPPYNVGKNYGVHDDDLGPEEYQGWLRSIFATCLTEELVYFPGTANVLDARALLAGSGFRPVRILGWHKKEFAGDKWCGGPAMCWEPIIWASRAENPSYTRIFGTQGRDFLVVSSIHGNPYQGPHPCPKPLPVMRWLLKLFAGGSDASVLDPLAGSGTTGLACKALGIPCTLIEIEERYCELAVKRLAQSVLPLEVAVYDREIQGELCTTPA